MLLVRAGSVRTIRRPDRHSPFRIVCSAGPATLSFFALRPSAQPPTRYRRDLTPPRTARQIVNRNARTTFRVTPNLTENEPPSSSPIDYDGRPTAVSSVDDDITYATRSRTPVKTQNSFAVLSSRAFELLKNTTIGEK